MLTRIGADYALRRMFDDDIASQLWSVTCARNTLLDPARMVAGIGASDNQTKVWLAESWCPYTGLGSWTFHAAVVPPTADPPVPPYMEAAPPATPWTNNTVETVRMTYLIVGFYLYQHAAYLPVWIQQFDVPLIVVPADTVELSGTIRVDLAGL